MARNQKEQVQASEQEASLISSTSLPEFDDIEKEYQEYIASLTPDTVSTPIKKTRGRKKADVIQADNEEISEGISPEQLENIVCFPLDSWFIRNDKKRLSNIERKAFAESCSRLANKWLPKIATQWQEEIGFCICMGTIFMSRMNVKNPEEKVDEREKEKEKETKI
jgi:hypothetical protein